MIDQRRLEAKIDEVWDFMSAAIMALPIEVDLPTRRKLAHLKAASAAAQRASNLITALLIDLEED